MAGNESLGRSEQMWKVLKESVKNLLVYGGSKTLLTVRSAAWSAALYPGYGLPGFVYLVYTWRRMERVFAAYGTRNKMSTIFV